MNSILKFCDIDGNGSIDFSEFISVCIDRKILLNEQRLFQLFNILDSDNNHVLSYDEVF